MKPEYAVVITRFVEGDDRVLIDKYITADEAIDLLLHIQENIDGPQGEAPEFAFGVVEDVEEPESEPAAKTKKYKKPADADEPIERLATTKEKTCGKCGKPGHNARSCGKGDIQRLKPVVDEGPAETAYTARRKAKDAEETEDEDPTLAELDRMAAEKLSQVELQEMFPSVPLHEIIKAWERYNHI